MKLASDRDLDAALRADRRLLVRCLFGGGPVLRTGLQQIFALAARHAISVIYELRDYVGSVEQIAAREKYSIRQVNMISLAFLAPQLMKAAAKGRLPCGIGVARLRDAPDRVVAPIRDARFVELIPTIFPEQLRPVPETGGESPETGSQNRGYRDLDRRQGPDAWVFEPATRRCVCGAPA